jgi:hypothetical protein
MDRMAQRTNMAVVEIRFRLQEGGLSLDEVVDKLLQSLKGARVTRDDWYGDFRRMALRLKADHERAGTPFDADRMLEDIDSAEKAAGRRKEIAIPLPEDRQLKGDISMDRLILSAGFPLEDHETVKAILDLLYSLDVVAGVEYPS